MQFNYFYYNNLKQGSSGVPGPENIRINFCDPNDLCAVPFGQTVQLEIDFIAGAATRRLVPTVNGPWWIFPKSTEDNLIGCNSVFSSDEKLGCPLRAGELYKYKIEIVIQELNLSLTDLNVDVEIELEGDGGKLICFNFKAFTVTQVQNN